MTRGFAGMQVCPHKATGEDSSHSLIEPSPEQPQWTLCASAAAQRFAAMLMLK